MYAESEYDIYFWSNWIFDTETEKLKKPKITDFDFRISDLGKGIVKF